MNVKPLSGQLGLPGIGPTISKFAALFSEDKMQTIYKYPVLSSDSFTLELPQGAEILTVQTQGGGVFLWALVSPDAPTEGRTFRLAGTGHAIHEREVGELRYIGTFQLSDGVLVFHLFEVCHRTAR